MAGFRDEDEDFDDLLKRSSILDSSSYSTVPATSGGFGSPTGVDEDLNSNPFADLQSSTAYLPATTTSTSFYSPASPSLDQNPSTFGFESPSITSTSTSDPTPARLSFARESAPEPETPSFSRTAVTTSYADTSLVSTDDVFSGSGETTGRSQSPFQSTSFSPPASSTTIVPPVDEQTPFGSPPPLSPTRLPTSIFIDEPSPSSMGGFAPPSMYRTPVVKPDLSALLGEEKPILPSFKKSLPQKAEGVAGPLGSKIAVLPVSSIGKKTVPGALATLLGLETEEEDESELEKEREKRKNIMGVKKVVEKKRESIGVVGVKKTVPVKEEPKLMVQTVQDEPVKAEDTVTEKKDISEASSLKTASPSVFSPTEDTSVEPTVTPEAAPPPPELTEPIEPTPSNALATALPVSRPETPTDPTTASTSTLDANAHMISGLSTPRDASPSRASSQAASMRSILSTDDIDDEDSQKRYGAIVSPMDTSDQNAWPSNKAQSSETPTVESVEQKLQGLTVDEEDITPTAENGRCEDVPDQMFAQYMADPIEASRAVEQDNSTDDRPDQARVDGIDEVAQSSRTEATSSPPLPPVPKMSSPTRSTHAGGSLGPSFIITVGDPQKVGNPLNVAAQHTVYTVRTRTTSSAFRKNDFSVLRRFSHFLWLFDALTINNPGVIVPGMPEKSAMGRFGSEFVENRRQGLQAALMKIVAHPMLVGDPDLRMFLESDSFAVDIKQRKLDVPSESKGFLASITSAVSGPSFVEFDEYFDTRRHQLESFETGLRSLIGALSNASKMRHSVQDALMEFQTSLAGLATCDLSKTLRSAIEQASIVQKKLHEIGQRQAIAEEQMGGLINIAETYARLCASARGVFGARIKAYHHWTAMESALKKSRAANEKAKRSGRGFDSSLGLAVAEVAEAERRALDAKQDFEDVSKLTKAEMARFDKEKIDDFKKALENYADGMAERQREIVVVWQEYYEMLQGVVQQQQEQQQLQQAQQTEAASVTA